MSVAGTPNPGHVTTLGVRTTDGGVIPAVYRYRFDASTFGTGTDALCIGTLTGDDLWELQSSVIIATATSDADVAIALVNAAGAGTTVSQINLKTSQTVAVSQPGSTLTGNTTSVNVPVIGLITTVSGASATRIAAKPTADSTGAIVDIYLRKIPNYRGLTNSGDASYSTL